jgi:hypothetical protein
MMRDDDESLPVNGQPFPMETLKNLQWPIVAIGGLGAFIDFFTRPD